MEQCWAQNKRLRPGIGKVVETMRSWKSPPIGSSPTPPISQSSDSIPRGKVGAPLYASSMRFFSHHSKKAEKSTSITARKAYHTKLTPPSSQSSDSIPRGKVEAPSYVSYARPVEQPYIPHSKKAEKSTSITARKAYHTNELNKTGERA